MSTICGAFARTPRPVAGIDAMLAALPGRDVDVTQTWIDGPVALGWRGDAGGGGRRDGREDCGSFHSRASPGIARDAQLAVLASVRIDGRNALCDALGVAYASRPGLADADLVLRAARRWAEESPSHLLGDYAFAVWDARRRTLLLARDHIGARPLYYSLTADRIVFASDVNAVLAAPGVPQSLDEAAVATWLDNGWWPRERTFYRSVQSLRPGHLLSVGADAARLVRWWRPEEAPAERVGHSDHAVAEAFLALYEAAVADRLRGADAVGIHLSGGLDSSSVAVLAARGLRRAGRPPPSAFSWQPAPASSDRGERGTEHRLIEAVARQERIGVIYCPPEADDIVAALRRDVTRHFNYHENEWPVQRRAADLGVRVLLSGWGGDECVSFDGRGYYPDLLRKRRLGALWRDLGHGRRPLANIALRAVLPLVWPAAGRLAQRVVAGRGRDGWTLRRRRGYLHPGLRRRVRPLPMPRAPAAGVREFQLFFLELAPTPRIEGWAASGASLGIEYRYPLLDRRLLEFALSLGAEQFRRGDESRVLMRRALAGVLPEAVRQHRSKDEPVRVDTYLNRFIEALPTVREILSSRGDAPSRSPYVDMEALVRDLDAAADRTGDRVRSGALTRALKFLDF